MKLLLLLPLIAACRIPVDQRAACAEYVTCIQARDALVGADTDLVRFQPDGECWDGALAADLCERACENGLTWLRERARSLPEECQP